MEKTFQLEIMTPEKQFFKGQAEGLIMPALDGEYGVQPGHEPIVTALEPGTVRYGGMPASEAKCAGVSPFQSGPGQGNGTAESGGQITGLGFEKKRGVSSWERNTAFLYTLLDQKGSHGKGMGKTCGNRDRLGGNRVEHRRCCP